MRRILADAGVATIDADQLGHDVLRPDGPAFGEVASRWPRVVEDGEIDRGALAAIVFDDPGELSELEAITHPHIFGIIRARVEHIDGPVVVEVPLIQHRLGGDWRRIVVDTRDDVRMQRALDRGMSESDARSRMDAQPPRAEWLAVADLVVPNNGSLSELGQTVGRIIGRL